MLARVLSLSLSLFVHELDALSFAHFCSYSWDALLGFSLVPDGFPAFFWCVCASFAWYRANSLDEGFPLPFFVVVALNVWIFCSLVPAAHMAPSARAGQVLMQFYYCIVIDLHSLHRAPGTLGAVIMQFFFARNFFHT